MSEGELCIDVDNIMGTESGVNDIDKPSTQSTSMVSAFSCVTCNVNFKTKNDLVTHIAECNKQGVWTSQCYIPVVWMLLFMLGLGFK